jgi:hypothetical protein
MQNFREYNEILSIMKKLIDKGEIKITKDSFTIQNLKNILLSFPQFDQEINSLKEKLKSQNAKNSNWFFMLKLLNKKKGKNSLLLINNINTNFQIMMNEPKFIIDLNKRIYELIIDDLKMKQAQYKMISIINGNFSTELFNIKEAFYKTNNFSDIKPELILREIYEAVNPNLNIFMKQSENLLTEWEKRKRFRFYLNGYSLESLKSTYSKLIFTWCLYNEEQINQKKRRNTFFKLAQENNKMQLLELCKEGIPHSLRKNVYSCLLNVSNHYQIKDINQNDHVFIFDYYILKDAHKIAAGENYFLFEENLIKLLCLMIRDHNLITEIQGIRPMLTLNLTKNDNSYINNDKLNVLNEHLKVIPIKRQIDEDDKSLFNDKDSEQNIIKSIDKKSYKTNIDSEYSGNPQIYLPFPPSGLFPSYGFAFQMAPFTYMSNNIDDFYLIAKLFYGKYLSFLSSYTSNKKSILSLLSSFDEIFYSMECFSSLKNHFKIKKFDINEEIINLFVTSFSNVVDPQNVFKIYDLIIITDNMGIFVLFGLSIVYYLKDELLNCNTKEEILSTFENIIYDQCDCLELMKDFINQV